MGVDHDNLEDSAAVGVTAVILITVSFLTFGMIIYHQMHLKYKEAQNLLILIFLMPTLIGWVAWVEIFIGDDLAGFEFLVNLFKAVCIAAFLFYTEKMLGWVQKEDKITYSEEQKLETLCHSTTHRFLCRQVEPASNTEEAKKYLVKVRIAILQNCVVLVVLGIVGMSMVIATDNYSLTDSTQNDIFTILHGIKGVSSLITVVAIFQVVWYVIRIPEMERFEFMHKLIIIKLGIIFTELQPIVIEACADWGLIASTDKYSVSEITTYTNALMTVCEMIIISFLLVIVFPVSDYNLSQWIKGRLANTIEERDDNIKS